MAVKKLTNKIIEKIIVEFNEPENMDKMKKNIVDPLIQYTYRQLYPYFLVAESAIFINIYISAIDFSYIITSNL